MSVVLYYTTQNNPFRPVPPAERGAIAAGRARSHDATGNAAQSQQVDKKKGLGLNRVPFFSPGDHGQGPYDYNRVKSSCLSLIHSPIMHLTIFALSSFT